MFAIGSFEGPVRQMPCTAEYQLASCREAADQRDHLMGTHICTFMPCFFVNKHPRLYRGIEYVVGGCEHRSRISSLFEAIRLARQKSVGRSIELFTAFEEIEF